MISLEKGNDAVSESKVKVELNGTNGFGMPFFAFSKITLPGVFGELAEQGIARAQEGCEKMKVASGEMTEALGEAYSSNTRSANDYGRKVIELANANTVSAIDFFTHLLGSKSVTDVFTLSAAQARKAFDTASAQNKELWALTQKLAAEAGEPIRKHVAKVLHH
jgi:phasin